MGERVRVTLIFEKVASTGEVTDKQAYGAFVRQPNLATAVETAVLNTVREEYPKFLQGKA